MNELLRAIPKVTELYDLPEVSDLREHYASSSVTEWIRTVLEQLRSAILSGEVTTLPTLEELGDRICRVAARESLPSLRPVINATGVILHTNLGRGCLSDRAADAVYDIARGYSTLEYNVEAGHRGSRHDHVEKLLCRLTGAESAMVVNNNAAAVMLILSTLAQGGEVITSRGELVEIGGSFRVPDIMELCGCHLREVGTTNKTHLSDYERAIGEQTRALLKVHTSNYRIVGFTESLPLSDIVALGCRTGLPVVEDLGSGSLVDLEHYGIHDEPTVQNSIRAGVDVVSFSGDKLLGGPQAGIILGKKPYIDRMKRHPLARAIRVDKMTIAALWATLTTYQDLHRAEQEIPTLAMLAALAIVLVALIHFPLVPAAPFLEYDPADIPIFIGTFLFGPAAGLALTAVVCVIQGVTVSAASGPIGIIMHFLATGTFVLLEGNLYRAHRTRKAALLGLAAGTLAMTAVMCVCNLVFTPLFMGSPVGEVVKLLLPAIIPFNLAKAAINSVITYLVYKPISRLVFGEKEPAAS